MMEGKTGRFGDYGGQYVPETMMNALQELEAAFLKIHGDKEFNRELVSLQQEFAGRPTPLTFCGNTSLLSAITQKRYARYLPFAKKTTHRDFSGFTRDRKKRAQRIPRGGRRTILKERASNPQ